MIEKCLDVYTLSPNGCRISWLEKTTIHIETIFDMPAVCIPCTRNQKPVAFINFESNVCVAQVSIALFNPSACLAGKFEH